MLSKRILTYLLFFSINIVALNFIVYYFVKPYYKISKTEAKCCAGATLSTKFEYYRQNKNNFNLLFIGDSRTYTNIDNYIIDSTLKTNSYNLGIWSNWFPTQYSFLKDILNEIPDSTTLIFSLGYQNFIGGEIQEVYPITPDKADAYYDWGFEKSDLKKPMRLADNDIKPVLFLSQYNLNNWFTEKLDKNYLAVFFKKKNAESKNTSENSSTTTSKVDALTNYFNSQTQVSSIQKRFAHDTLTSLEVYWKKGNYWRVELDSLFFREKQKEDSLVRKPINKFEPDERYWKNFEGIIQLLSQHTKRLNIIVNEVGEAPYVYRVEKSKASCEKFLATKVKPFIEANGIKYIKVEVNDLGNSLYFDHNHFNDKGTVLYTQRLSDLLKVN